IPRLDDLEVRTEGNDAFDIFPNAREGSDGNSVPLRDYDDAETARPECKLVGEDVDGAGDGTRGESDGRGVRLLARQNRGGDSGPELIIGFPVAARRDGNDVRNFDVLIRKIVMPEGECAGVVLRSCRYGPGGDKYFRGRRG